MKSGNWQGISVPARGYRCNINQGWQTTRRRPPEPEEKSLDFSLTHFIHISISSTSNSLYQFILVLWIPHRYLCRNRGSHDWSTLWSQSTSKTFEHILQKINQIFQNWNYNLVSAMEVYYFHIILSITLTVTMRINSTTSWSCWREIPTFLVGRKRCQWRNCDREA